jgi:hypothetical protein
MIKYTFSKILVNFQHIFDHFDGQILFFAYRLLFVIYQAVQNITYPPLKYSIQRKFTKLLCNLDFEDFWPIFGMFLAILMTKSYFFTIGCFCDLLSSANY